MPIRSTANERAPVVQKKLAKSERAQLKILAKHVISARKSAWACQDALGEKRHRASVDVWSLPQAVKYRLYVVNKWLDRGASCEERKRERLIPLTNDWQTSVKLVQRIYPGTSGWLLYISDREGGHGGFVMNHQGSGAGGWMQFMSSTYYAYNDAAFADARRRGFVVPQSANSWTHPLGQAITAGYMRYTGRDGCHWCL
jgi:hypothetical protein